MTSLLDLVVRIAGFSMGAVLAATVLMAGGWRTRRDLLALLACALAYLVCSAPGKPCSTTAATLPLLLAAAAFPFAFWRLARVVLEERPAIPLAAWVGLGLLVVGGMAGAADYALLPGYARSSAMALHKAAALGFVGAALFSAWRTWDGDLVAPRRGLRWLLVVYIGLHGLIVLGFELYLRGAPPPPELDLLNATVIGATLLASLLYLVHPRAEAMRALFAPADKVPPSPSDEHEPVLRRLRELMESARLYQQPELTVGSLAARAGVPEYLLRRVIHERLGHRHFASYVNEFRLQEVAGRLRDPAEARRPILTLALEAGFGSIGPFNRAFRERFGTTPSAYRAAAGLTP